MAAQTLTRQQITRAFAEQPELLSNFMTPSKWEKVIYYKKPDAYLDAKTRTWRPNRQAGWIFWGDSQDARQIEYMRERNVPLLEFGVISDASDAFNRYGNWGPILTHPDGPKQFPVSQLLTLRWFDPAACPVPGVRFPQLRGVKIKEYDCPECGDRRFLEPYLLGRHLRVSHEYTPEDLRALSQSWKLDFDKDYAAKGRIEHEYPYDDDESDEEAAEADVPREATYQVEAEAVHIAPVAEAGKRAK